VREKSTKYARVHQFNHHPGKTCLAPVVLKVWFLGQEQAIPALSGILSDVNCAPSPPAEIRLEEPAGGFHILQVSLLSLFKMCTNTKKKKRGTKHNSKNRKQGGSIRKLKNVNEGWGRGSRDREPA
jgi:hypothetical protein